MKKSLSAILSLAMAFSMFSSVALGADAKKSSADFTDLKDLDAATKAKFDEMIGAGIFEGDSKDSPNTFGLKNKMTRAQFAKVAALIFNLKVDTSLKTSSFSDVKSDDPANGWAVSYIEAVKQAGITDGYAPGQFNPGGDVTKEQLAAFLLRGLGKDSEGKNKTGVSDKTVSEWARGYVALALELKLMGNGTDGAFGGTSAATRDLLVTSSYEAKKQFVDTNKPAKASVKEVKAVDYNKVQVTLDRDVDTNKATFVLKKGTVETKYEVKDKNLKWSDDKKVATLTLKDGAKIVEDTYSVTLGGLDASAVDVVTKEFKGEKEVLKTIDFVAASETVARSKKVRIQIKPTNQYGQLVSFPAGNFSVIGTLGDSNPTIKKSPDGTKMYVELSTDNPNVYSDSTTFSLNIYSTDQRDITKTKIFKIGQFPLVSKIELGEMTYSNDKTAIHSTGDEAVIKMTQFDQYGGEITADSGSKDSKIQEPNFQFIPKGNIYGENPLDAKTEDKDSDGVKEAVVFVKSDKKITTTGEYTLSVWNGGANAQTSVKVSASKIATKFDFGNFSKNTIAVGDKDIYLEFKAYDAEGNQLTQDEIVDNVKDKRFNFQVNGPMEFGPTADVPSSMLDSEYKAVVLSGEHKGKIHFAKVNSKNNGQVWVYIPSVIDSNNNKYQPYTTNEARYPSSIKEVTQGANKSVAGAEIKPKYQVIDNYSEVLTELPEKITDSSGKTVTYDIYATVARGNVNFKTIKADKFEITGDGAVVPIKSFSDKEITLQTTDNSGFGTAEVKFAIRKLVDGTVTDSNVNNITKKVTVIDPNKEDLKYSLAPLGDLFKTIDDGTYSATSQKGIFESKLAKQVKVEARDTSGTLVAYPKRIVEVTADTYSVLRTTERYVGENTTNPTSTTGYVLGNKTGTSSVTAYFKNAKGIVEKVSGTATVKGDAVKIESIKRGDSSKTFKTSELTDPVKGWYLMGDLTLKDQYGDEFKNEFIYQYDRFTGVRYTITDATTNNNQPIATVDPSNPERIIINGTGTFTITATTSNGLSTSTTVVISN